MKKDGLDWALIVLRVVHLVCVAIVVVLVVRYLQTRPNEALAMIVGLMLVNVMTDRGSKR